MRSPEQKAGGQRQHVPVARTIGQLEEASPEAEALLSVPKRVPRREDCGPPGRVFAEGQRRVQATGRRHIQARVRDTAPCNCESKHAPGAATANLRSITER